MNKYLFLFTIGPVQSFIAEARKTRDLWAGSRLLSDLIEVAIKVVESLNNDSIIIFPADKIESKPNRFVAVVGTDEPQSLGIEVENKVRETFKNIANEIFAKKFNINLKPNSFDKQISNFLEIYWVILPYENNYEEVYPKIEQYLGAIKNTKRFNQILETGRKCSLCGKRNALFYKKTTNGKKPAFIQSNAIEIKDDVVMTSGEGLCAICFIKRFYEKDNKDYPSTARIAMMDWLEQIEKEEGNRAIDTYKKLFQNFDEQIFYEENLRKEYLEKHNHFTSEENLNKAKKILKDLYKTHGRPKKYYALVMFDGDNMGKWLSGKLLENRMQLKEFHNKISEQLGKYAKKISGNKEEGIAGLIQQPKGKFVYAGGDDVMAFVNLSSFFYVLKELRVRFPKFEDLGFKLKDNNKSSASAGIVIAHYKTPLSEVFKWARKMEKKAKEEGDRDALAIAVLKHSGEIHSTVYKWHLEEKEDWAVDLMWELILVLKDKKEGFSSTFIKILQQEFRKIDKIPNDEEVMEIELARLLYRSSNIDNRVLKKEKTKYWTGKLATLYLTPISNQQDNLKQNFFNFLNIADFLSRGGR